MTAPPFDLFDFFGLSPPPSAPAPLPLPTAPTEPPPRKLTAAEQRFALPHLKWARAIARGVANDFGFFRGSQERLELEQTAYLVLCEYALRFDPARVPAGGDPAGQFRGWCSREVRSRCRRVAAQLQNGGTARTTNNPEVKRMKVGGLPDRCPNCADVMRGDRGEGAEEDEAPELCTRFEPVLEMVNTAPDGRPGA